MNIPFVPWIPIEPWPFWQNEKVTLKGEGVPQKGKSKGSNFQESINWLQGRSCIIFRKYFVGLINSQDCCCFSKIRFPSQPISEWPKAKGVEYFYGVVFWIGLPNRSNRLLYKIHGSFDIEDVWPTKNSSYLPKKKGKSAISWIRDSMVPMVNLGKKGFGGRTEKFSMDEKNQHRCL